MGYIIAAPTRQLDHQTMNFTGQRKQEPDPRQNPVLETVASYMSTELVTFNPNQDINEAIGAMLDRKISGAPVLDDSGTLVGILSEKDCLKVLIDDAYHNQFHTENKVSDYMSTDVETVSIESSVVDVANKFNSRRFRRFPVVDAEGKVRGQISRRDILKAAQKLKMNTW